VAITCNKNIIRAYNKTLANIANNIAIFIVAYLKGELDKLIVLSFTFVYSAINKTYKL
jgi:cadmium resistance protein CadD (predicted permease)